MAEHKQCHILFERRIAFVCCQRVVSRTIQRSAQRLPITITRQNQPEPRRQGSPIGKVGLAVRRPRWSRDGRAMISCSKTGAVVAILRRIFDGARTERVRKTACKPPENLAWRLRKHLFPHSELSRARLTPTCPTGKVVVPIGRCGQSATGQCTGLPVCLVVRRNDRREK